MAANRILFTLVGITLLAQSALAADYIVHVPDHLVEEGLKWNGWYRNEGAEQHGQTKEQWFLDRCILPQSLAWVRDFFIISVTYGKVRSFESSGITVEVHS